VGKKTVTLREKPAKASATPLVSTLSASKNNLTIVGIGSSAGGLEALEQFFRAVPAGSGLAYVIVQHLDPTHKGIMVELLQHSTPMKVVQIIDRMKVEPGCVYLIPPNCDLSILHGVLHLLEPTAPRGLRLPIDSFFRTLADDQMAGSIGVILSGMGSDGTLGLRAIKEKGGAVFVQEPRTAKFDGMPRSALESGCADVVAPAEELVAKILAYLKHMPSLIQHTSDKPAEKDQSALEKIILLLRTAKSHDFSNYKKSTIYRRVERRMGLHQLTKISDYVRYIQSNPQEAELLYKELLIGVTSFFRDAAVWEELKSVTLPSLLAARPGGQLRAWCAGCSTGEEAYSLAMLFREVMEKQTLDHQFSLQIFATDLDDEAVDKARAGFYPANIAADVSEERLRRFFVQTERGFQVSKDIREMVIFAHQNLISDPPFTKLDFLSCRNLLIYLDAELQKKLLPLFYYSLNPDGVLLLGNSESIGTAVDMFAPIAVKERLYRRLSAGVRTELTELPSMPFRRVTKNFARLPQANTQQMVVSLQAQTESLLLNLYAPAAVLTTDQGEIVFISGKTGKYLEPAAGRANLNIFAMAREGLSAVLSATFAQAIRKREVKYSRSVPVEANGHTLYVDLTVQPLTEPEVLRGMVLVVFTDVAAPSTPKTKAKVGHATAAQIGTLSKELLQTQQALQITREEMQTSQEELQSINEELQSTNEELQSTNEELTTSKEEMQSMNEELQTVNQELIAKVDGLSRANDDMNNLLNTIAVATLFLDSNLKVRRFTTQTLDIIKLIPSDLGRPISDMDIKLDYPQLAEDAREVLRTLVFKERKVTGDNKRWFLVRVAPYRTQTNRIDGLVIGFVDITEMKKLEGSMRKSLALLKGRKNSTQAGTEEGIELEGLLSSAEQTLEECLSEIPNAPTHDKPVS
jgi:two-component system CheB/CheR fusion protein